MLYLWELMEQSWQILKVNLLAILEPSALLLDLILTDLRDLD